MIWSRSAASVIRIFAFPFPVYSLPFYLTQSSSHLHLKCNNFDIQLFIFTNFIFTINISGISFARHELPKTLFLLGGYTDKSVLAHNPAGGEGDGVYSVLFDPMLGKIQILESSKVETNPAFIMKHPRLDIVYMTTEVIDRGNDNHIIRTSGFM